MAASAAPQRQPCAQQPEIGGIPVLGCQPLLVGPGGGDLRSPSSGGSTTSPLASYLVSVSSADSAIVPAYPVLPPDACPDSGGRTPGSPRLSRLLLPGMRVEIWSDVVCPWCYLGKKRFERALADFEHGDEVKVVYRSFELDPDAPQDRTTPTVELLASRYRMTPEQAEQAQRQMQERAAADGLTFRMDSLRSGNTRDAHRVLQLAKGTPGKQEVPQTLRLRSAARLYRRMDSDHHPAAFRHDYPGAGFRDPHRVHGGYPADRRPLAGG